jgi:hypothetical protein
MTSGGLDKRGPAQDNVHRGDVGVWRISEMTSARALEVLPSLYQAFLGYTVLFVFVGLALLFLRKAATNEVGPGYWALAYFLHGAGFLAWTGTVTSRLWDFYLLGDLLHLAGFVLLVCGIYRFAGFRFRRWNLYALGAFVLGWFCFIVLLQRQFPGAFLFSSALRAVLLLWSGHMILRLTPSESLEGRRLAGWGLTAWGVSALGLPVLLAFRAAYPLAVGLLVGLQMLVVLGMVILVVDRMRLLAEAIATHAGRLEGLLPICAFCKRIRAGDESWHSVEEYIRDRSDADFTHGVCPDCMEKYYPGISALSPTE